MFRPACAALLAAAPLAMPDAARAATWDVTGTGHGTSMNETTQVGDSMVVVHASTQYERFEMEEPESPLARLTGPCFGAMLVRDGQPKGSGTCHYTDTDGGAVVMEWTAEAISDEGRTTGSWEIAGGTGAWAEASGAGTFDAGTDAGGAYTNRITGQISLP